MPYVPFQQNNPQKYAQTEALSNGTLFPGLNLPFHLAGEGGLGGVQRFRRPGDVFVPGHRQKIPQYPQLHVALLLSYPTIFSS